MGKKRSFCRALIFLAASLPPLFAAGASGYKVFDGGSAVIYYPAAWNKTADMLEGGTHFYSRYVWHDERRPSGSKNWVDIEFRRLDPQAFELKRPPGISDYIADKRCEVKKCDLWTQCPAHSAAREFPTRLFAACKATQFPRLTGGTCGTYYDRVKIGGDYFYFFNDKTKGTAFSSGEEPLTEITVFFAKGGSVYRAELVCPEGEYDAYKAQLIWMLTNFKAKRQKQG